MSKKRVLLVHPDTEVREFLREKLDSGGYEVFVADSGESAVAAFEDHTPDLIALDLMLSPVSAGPELVRTIRTISTQVPIFGLSGAVPAFIASATQAGITKILPPTANPVYQLVSTVRNVLGGTAAPPPLAAESTERHPLLARVPDLVNAIRLELRTLSKETTDLVALERLRQQAHALSQRVSFAGLAAVNKLTSALELLLFDFQQTPEAMNASTLRTIGQAADAIAPMIDPTNLPKLKEPTAARVCTIDDEPGAREMIILTMQLAGLKSIGAGSPEEGLAVLQDGKFDLIFLDVGMPGMNGFEVCQKIREIPHHKETPVIFVTGMATFQNRAQGMLSGANDFVGKPFNLPELALKALLWIFKAQLDSK